MVVVVAVVVEGQEGQQQQRSNAQMARGGGDVKYWIGVWFGAAPEATGCKYGVLVTAKVMP